jgi:ribosomal protein S18 acetylase RimI-like enzyme
MIKIRKFKIEEYDELIKLWNSVKLPYKPNGRDSYEKIQKEIKKNNSIFLVAEYNSKIIGSIIGTHDGRKGWINRLAVSKDFQRKDLAKKLCKNVEEKFLELGIEIYCCLIEDWNKKSLNFFKKIGYTKHHDIYYFSKRKKNYI